MRVEDQVLKAFAEKVAEEFPQLLEILDQAKAGTLTELDAMRALSEVIMTTPGMGNRFQQVAMEMMSPLREEDRSQPLDHDGMILHKERGLPQLNPLVEASLIERTQFDEDIPELRTGNMVRGVAPAVSVDTRVRNPVALGQMLTVASKQVADQIALAEPERLKTITKVALGETDALALIEQTGLTLTAGEARDQVLDGKTAALDIPEYRRGAVPAMVQVAPPTGSALLAMTPQEKKQSAWKFLSTTQGRRTAVAGLTELIEVKLRGEGFEVRVRPFEPGARELVLAAHEWTVGIDGPGAMQAAFSLIDIAAAAITKGITRQMKDRRGKVILEVTAINTVDIRSVGWAGRLLSQDGMLPEA